MNYINLRTAIRNLWKNKHLSLLNIIGLGTGLAVAILIFNYVNNEFEADNYHKNIDNIYVLQNNNKTHVHYEITPLIKEQIPAIENIALVESTFKDKYVLQYQNEEALKTEIVFTGSNFTKIFNFNVVAGSLEDALVVPQSMILTESEAKKIFGKRNAIGEILSIKGENVYLGKSATIKTTAMAN